MKKKSVSFVCCFLMLFAAAASHAQAGFTGPGFTGPGSGNFIPNNQPVMQTSVTSVSEARTLPHDSWVMLSGNIINMLPGGRNYTFRDSSPQGGEIAVDIGPKEWRGLSVGPSDRVEIYGEVKITRGQVSIKVHAITGAGGVNARLGQAVTVSRPISINEAITLPHDSWVVLTGNIIETLPGKHNYLFQQGGAGDITVDIGPKEWRGLSAGPSDRVEIYGEVKHHRGQSSIKVHAIIGL